MNAKGILKRLLVGVMIFLVVTVTLFWFATYHPTKVQNEAVTCPQMTPTLRSGQSIKVLTWNVQFMAGKKYTFWFDVPNNDGPDERPASEDVTATLQEVARVIRAENPDIIYLQEVDKGALRTEYRDELRELVTLIPGYPCYAQTYYWKNVYVPHPRIHGSTGLTLATLSKYKIEKATRYQLALPPADPLTQQFSAKRAILDVRMPVNGTADFHALNTHLDAFAQGNNTMNLQVQEVDEVLSELEETNNAWVIGGDYNLLPPDDASRQRLPTSHQSYYNPQPEIKLLYAKYSVIPSMQESTGADCSKWFTYLPNDPTIPYADSTLDYLFYSKLLVLGNHYVRSADTQKISDHMPVVGVFSLP